MKKEITTTEKTKPEKAPKAPKTPKAKKEPKVKKEPKNKGSDDSKKEKKEKKPKSTKKKSDSDKKGFIPVIIFVVFILLTVVLVYAMLKGSGNTTVGHNPSAGYTQQSPSLANPASPDDQGPNPVLPGDTGSGQIDGAAPASGSGPEPVAAQAGLQAAPLAGQESGSE